MKTQINSLAEQFISVIKGSGLFDDCDIIRAYPNRKCPARLDKKTIAVGVMGVQAGEPFLDSDEKDGGITLFADIFIPLSMSCDVAINTFSDICIAAEGFNITGVSADAITPDKLLSAYVLKTSVTIKNIIDFGGGDNE